MMSAVLSGNADNNQTMYICIVIPDVCMLMGQSNEIFDPQYVFIIRTCLGHRPKGLNIFDFGIDFGGVIQIFRISPGYHTAGSQSLQSIIPRGVSLPGVSYRGESLMNLASQQPCQKTFEHDFNGTVSQKNVDTYSTKKGIHTI